MKKTVLFIDRDGTIIDEPLTDFQVDSLEKLSFLPMAIHNLYKIKMLHRYELAMVTNQDGLGTESFPRAAFELVHNKMTDTLKNEGIQFDEMFIDDSFEHENKPTRKPRTGLLTKYFTESYNLSDSFVIGDRLTDVELAKNMGCKAIFLRNRGNQNIQIPEYLNSYLALDATSWDEIYLFLRSGYRKVTVQRKTKETNISITLNPDGKSEGAISTGLNFFNHMLDQIRTHASFNLTIQCDGDLEVDEHHTIEDTAIAFGEAIGKAIGNKAGINRYGFYLPMDDSIANVALDFGGRSWLVWDVVFKREKIGDVPTEMFYHFFKSFADSAKCNINIKAEGTNEHHLIEGIFKAFARALKQAVEYRPENNITPSSKGIY